MNIKEYLESLKITLDPVESEDGYVVTIKDSEEYGNIFSRLEDSEDLDLLEDNQVITEQGSSLIYESLSEDLLLTLIADFEGDVYELIINKI